MDNATVAGPLRAPNWTERNTREALGRSSALGGLNIREAGWYEVKGGVALISDPRGEGSEETFRASVWEGDPRSNLAAVLSLSTQSIVTPQQFIANWVGLRELSRKLAKVMADQRAKAGAKAVETIDPLPESPPGVVRICGNPVAGGHCHVEDFQLTFVSMAPDDLRQAKESGEKPGEDTEVMFLEDGAIVLEMY